jgi:hypothetical protein
MRPSSKGSLTVLKSGVHSSCASERMKIDRPKVAQIWISILAFRI